MAYIRTKIVKGKKYGYLVECKYKKRGNKGPKQSVKAYIGRVYEPIEMNKTDFYHYSNIDQDHLKDYIKDKETKDIIENLLRWELTKHGFEREKFSDKTVLKINEGYLCMHSINRILNFKPKGDDDIRNGRELAKLFVNGGMNAPHEVFVEYFKKVGR